MRSDDFWIWFETEAAPKLRHRERTFRAMFEHLDKFEALAAIETGCIEEPDNWAGNGCSTIMFDRYVATHPSAAVISIELDAGKVERAKLLCRHVDFVQADSAEYLRRLAPRMSRNGIDLLYLDASDLRWNHPAPASNHHLNELLAAMPMIREDTLVAVDDAPALTDEFPLALVGGKGAYVADYARGVGATQVFGEYQIGWVGMNRQAPREDTTIAVLIERARAAVEAGHATEASPIYRQVLALTNPPSTGRERIARGEACAFFAQMAVISNRLGAAADWFRRATDADPHGVDYRLDMIQKCLLPIGHLRGALSEAEKASQIAPDYPRVWKILGGVAHEAGEAEKAVKAYDRGLQLQPYDPDAALDRATIALDLADYATASACCEIAMGTEREADALHCMGMIAFRRAQHEDAIDLYGRAIAAGAHDIATVRLNRSYALHAIGRYREGWEDHEQREHNAQNPALYLPMRRFKLPRWKGELPGIPTDDHGIQGVRSALIHVHYEAGAGDNLAMVRYLPLIRERGFRVRFECAEEMIDLIRHSFPDIQIVPKAPDYPGALGIEPFDYHVPIGSLPAIFGTEISTVPWYGPYLRPDPILVERFRTKLGRKGQRKIGLCWSSGIRKTGLWITEYGLRKSMHFDRAYPIYEAALEHGVSMVSLQVGPERIQHGDELIDILPEKPTWHETAALIACLDMVVTVDTGVAHLAGAMGKPTLLMCQRDGASWHFMCWRPNAPWNKTSPWYPAIKVFRQREFNRPHHWVDVVADVAEEIGRWSRSGGEVEAAAG